MSLFVFVGIFLIKIRHNSNLVRSPFVVTVKTVVNPRQVYTYRYKKIARPYEVKNSFIFQFTLEYSRNANMIIFPFIARFFSMLFFKLLLIKYKIIVLKYA